MENKEPTVIQMPINKSENYKKMLKEVKEADDKYLNSLTLKERAKLNIQ